MIHLKINGKPRELPERWEEVTFAMFLDLIAAKDDNMQLLSILLDIPIQEIRGAKIQGLELILRRIQFLKTIPAIDKTPISLGEYVFPRDVTFETVEQFEEVRAEINRVGTTEDIRLNTEAMAFYAAIYCAQPYDKEKAMFLAKAFMKYPCLEVMAAGSFFQAKCLSIQSGLSMNYLRKNTLLKSSRPGLKRFLKRLAFMLRLTPSRGM